MDYHNNRFKDHSLMVYKNDELVALLPANTKDEVIHSHQGLTYGGLLFKPDFSFKNALFSFKAILEYLDSKGFETLQLKMLPKIYNAANNFPLDYLMFVLNAKLEKTDVLSVVEPQKKAYSKRRIRGVKKGIKHNLEVKEVNDFSEFWNTLLIPNLKAKHNTKPVHTLEEITLLKSKFPNNIRQFNVYYNNEIVAGTTIFETTQVAHSQYIAGNYTKNTLGSLDILHAHLLEDVFANKLFFDFGISNENQGKNINEGLLYWKEGFGARTVTQDFYAIPTKNHHLLDQVFI